MSLCTFPAPLSQEVMSSVIRGEWDRKVQMFLALGILTEAEVKVVVGAYSHLELRGFFLSLLGLLTNSGPLGYRTEVPLFLLAARQGSLTAPREHS